MTEMASTTGAGYLGADHSVTAVFVLFNMLLAERIVKAGPTATRVKLGFRGK